MNEEDEKGDDGRMMRRGRTPSPSPDRARARSSGARSSGGQRPRPPDAGATGGPPWQATRAHTAPRKDRPRGSPPQDGRHRGGEYPEGEVQRLNGYTEAGLARQYIPTGQMEYWLGMGWSEHRSRH
eukprot:4890789-Pyramimonas_sp.AAC.1